MQPQCSATTTEPPDTRTSDIEERALPPLRSDLQFHPVRESEGNTTWMLYDPLRGQYLELGELELLVLHYWHFRSPQAIANRIARDHGCAISAEEVEAVARFVKDNELLQSSSKEIERKLASINLQQQRLQTLQKTVFWRRPLFIPNLSSYLLRPLARCTAYPAFYAFLGLVAIASALSIGQHWPEFLAYFSASWNAAGAVTFFLCYLLLSLFHELGHASVARLYGVRANSIGVGLIALFPIMFSEITDAWRLPRRARLHISAGGVLFEATLGVAAAATWCLLDDGSMRSLAFYLFTTSLITTLLINANPLMKFDGYYLLSDFTGEKNLQQTATSTLRQWAWGVLVRQPTPPTNRRQKLLILFGIAGLLYRISVFMLISYAAYQLLFKAAGVLILLICVGLLLVVPSVRETLAFINFLKEQDKRPIMRKNSNQRPSPGSENETVESNGMSPLQKVTNYLRLLNPKFLGALTVLTALLLIPLPWPVQLPASTFFADSQKVMAPAGAVLESLDLKPDSEIRTGAVIARLQDPELDYRIARTEEELQLLQRRQDSDGFAESLDALDGVYLQDLLSKQQLLRTLHTEKQQLEIIAKVSGHVDWILPGLHSGQYLDLNQPFITIVDRTTLRGRAYGRSQQITRLTPRENNPMYGRLFLDGGWQPVAVTVSSVDQIASRKIQDPALASDYGGPLQTLPDDPERSAEALHLVNFSIANDGEKMLSTAQRTGHLVLFGEPVSLLKLLTDRIAGVVIRESGV
ncbi:zinc metalloprotease [Microbulbifer celer]|uniref:Peptide zinc metalloprotease protein n=1 Tax=Microbulbifer celer TaxID=435905 RepID=A0ABW3U9N2_9GAMM|nr:hypothetical protein [Microbulbifer celer]UFN56507.1 hypothetical protein LPW13_13130 [Microbulbifer celer]